MEMYMYTLGPWHSGRNVGKIIDLIGGQLCNAKAPILLLGWQDVHLPLGGHILPQSDRTCL